MSLDPLQRRSTKQEFQKNLSISGLTINDLAKHFNVSPEKIEQIMNLKGDRIEDPWIIRNYLLLEIQNKNKEATPFTALKGDFHDYWFLNSAIIEKAELF